MNHITATTFDELSEKVDNIKKTVEGTDITEENRIEKLNRVANNGEPYIATLDEIKSYLNI